MKRILYIVVASFLGFLMATIIHGIVELFALRLIFGQPELYADTFWWREWDFIHNLGSTLLWLSGIAVGAYLGAQWWEPYGRLPGFYHWKKLFR